MSMHWFLAETKSLAAGACVELYFVVFSCSLNNRNRSLQVDVTAIIIHDIITRHVSKLMLT